MALSIRWTAVRGPFLQDAIIWACLLKSARPLSALNLGINGWNWLSRLRVSDVDMTFTGLGGIDVRGALQRIFVE